LEQPVPPNPAGDCCATTETPNASTTQAAVSRQIVDIVIAIALIETPLN